VDFVVQWLSGFIKDGQHLSDSDWALMVLEEK
jgi:hypothetical protein